jgi:plastocyanin
VVLLVIGLGIYFINSNNNSNVAPLNNSDNAKTVQQLTASVNIKGFAFIPSTLNIKPGTKVTWTNNDSVTHTVTSDDGQFFDSGNIAPGQSFSFIFASPVPSTTKYHCAIHSMMKGAVITKK